MASEESKSPGNILVTGGAGYIGSHTLVQLLEAGYSVTVFDNLCNSSAVSLDRVAQLTGVGEDKLKFIKGDVSSPSDLDRAFTSASFDAVIHFAALKAVGESVKLPLKYYANNVTGTLELVNAMNRHDVKQIVFSSSATVYGTASSPLTEDSQVGVGITNPYGQSKYMIECVLKDLYRSDPEWGVVLLRYFNPVGAHPSGCIGEDPAGIPNNLMPYVQQVAIGKREKVTVFGNDYDTPDGTGVRDYIHVVDLAAGHLKALEYLARNSGKGCEVFNLGTGTGYSVLQMIEAMKKASGRDIAYTIGDRRAGDLATVFANPAKANEVLGWNAKLGLDEMCRDAWKWQADNPDGYPAAEGEGEGGDAAASDKK